MVWEDGSITRKPLDHNTSAGDNAGFHHMHRLDLLMCPLQAGPRVRAGDGRQLPDPGPHGQAPGGRQPGRRVRDRDVLRRHDGDRRPADRCRRRQLPGAGGGLAGRVDQALDRGRRLPRSGPEGQGRRGAQARRQPARPQPHRDDVDGHPRDPDGADAHVLGPRRRAAQRVARLLRAQRRRVRARRGRLVPRRPRGDGRQHEQGVRGRPPSRRRRRTHEPDGEPDEVGALRPGRARELDGGSRGPGG